MKTYRLNRLFHAKSGRCFDVAVDHGFFNEASFLGGIEDMAAAVRVLVEAAPDAIQLTDGQARLLQNVPGKDRPALVLRTDVANVYGRELPRHLFSTPIEEAALTGVRLDAACIVVNLFRIPDQPEVYHDCIRNIVRLRAECERYAMPLMVEPLVFRPNAEAGGYMVDGDVAKIVPLVRQAVELGADIIKADPTDEAGDYHKVVRVAGDVPVLVRGGGRVDDTTLLKRTAAVLEQGARGIVYGRNVIQHDSPRGHHAGADGAASRRGGRGRGGEDGEPMSSARKQIRFGVIGGGLMGREFAAAAARWCQLDAGPTPPDHEPVIAAVCDLSPQARAWFERNCPVRLSTERYQDLLDSDDIDALYIAVPHDLHERVYVDCVRSGKAILGEKPFGVDRAANARITAAIDENPKTFVRCSSEIPFFPGAQRIVDMVERGDFGTILDVEAGFWHSSDLNADKPINWKRQVAHCGEYGVLGDLGMHPLHLPLRFGWLPSDVRGVLSKIVETRPKTKGSDERVPCETWDNAALLTRVKRDGQDFPMTVSVKRIAPGHQNTWFLRVAGTRQSAQFSTENPKILRTLPYPQNGGPQAWHVEDVAFDPPYASVTGPIFEFGFSDAVQQMWAAFCDEMLHGRDDMRQAKKRPFYCATPEEARQHHAVLDAALRSHNEDRLVTLDW